MNKRILLVFPGLRPHLNEGAKHRLNSYIENYKTQGYIVDVLCFYRDISYIGRLNKYINSNANWHFYPMNNTPKFYSDKEMARTYASFHHFLCIENIYHLLILYISLATDNNGN